jgi:hypothetical protein
MTQSTMLLMFHVQSDMSLRHDTRRFSLLGVGLGAPCHEGLEGH